MLLLLLRRDLILSSFLFFSPILALNEKNLKSGFMAAVSKRLEGQAHIDEQIASPSPQQRVRDHLERVAGETEMRFVRVATEVSAQGEGVSETSFLFKKAVGLGSHVPRDSFKDSLSV